MRLGRWIPVLTVLLAVGCADFKELLALSSALQRQYGAPASVNLTNGTHLVVTFRKPDGMAKTDSAGRAVVAESVAVFVKGHYPDAQQLEDITVDFATVTSMGPISVTRVDVPYTFAVRELPQPSSRPLPNAAQQQRGAVWKPGDGNESVGADRPASAHDTATRPDSGAPVLPTAPGQGWREFHGDGYVLRYPPEATLAAESSQPEGVPGTAIRGPTVVVRSPNPEIGTHSGPSYQLIVSDYPNPHGTSVDAWVDSVRHALNALIASDDPDSLAYVAPPETHRVDRTRALKLHPFCGWLISRWTCARVAVSYLSARRRPRWSVPVSRQRARPAA